MTLDLTTDVATIGFADDLGLTVVARLLVEVETYTNETVHGFKSWLKNVGLSLTEHKMEVVINIIYKLKCLGVMIDQNLNFKLQQQLGYIAPEHCWRECYRMQGTKGQVFASLFQGWLARSTIFSFSVNSSTGKESK